MSDWQPTCYLRAKKLTNRTSQLQQKWVSKSTGKEEWRAVPVVGEDKE